MSPSAPGGKISLFTATSLVIANMVGTGVFTSLGLQSAQLASPSLILLVWILGGFFALCGALSYGELASALPRSGGEYHFLSRIYHPGVGFVAGWVSATVGFAAPLALGAMAFGKYFQGALPGTSALYSSLAVVVATALAHLIHLRFGAWFQNTFTSLKLLLILAFICLGFHLAPHTPHASLSLLPRAEDLFPGPFAHWAPFAISLLYVMYAYSGWNASVYVAQEISDPRRALPRSLCIGTILVTLLYVGLNWVFLLSTTREEIAGEIDVGAISARHLFGTIGGQLVSGLISLCLISCISAMTWAGPRVWQTMGEDYRLLRFLAKRSRNGLPVRASLFQMLIVIVLLLTSTFEAILVYTQFTLNLCAFLTVLGVIVLRKQQPALPRPYRTWGYPFTPLAFLSIAAATMIYMIATKPIQSLASFATLALGTLFYFLSAPSRLLPTPLADSANETHQPSS